MKGDSNILRCRRARMAAVLAISNLGHAVPGVAASNPENWTIDPAWEMEKLAGHLWEGREHEEIFKQEARMWLTYVATTKYVDILRTHVALCPALYDIGEAEFPPSRR